VSAPCCVIASNPNREDIEREVLAGRKDIALGAKELNVSYEVFWKHITQHVKVEEEAKTIETLSEKLDFMMNELFKRFKKIVKLPVQQGNEREVKAAASSLLDCVLAMAKLKKIINTAPQVNIHTFNVQMTKLIEFLHTELPSEYQQKVIDFLEANR